VTYIYEGGPAYHAGLHVHDKLLQVNISQFQCTESVSVWYL